MPRREARGDRLFETRCAQSSGVAAYRSARLRGPTRAAEPWRRASGLGGPPERARGRRGGGSASLTQRAGRAADDSVVLPIRGGTSLADFNVDELEPSTDHGAFISDRVELDPAFFEAAGVEIFRGRNFSEAAGVPAKASRKCAVGPGSAGSCRGVRTEAAAATTAGTGRRPAGRRAGAPRLAGGRPHRRPGSRRLRARRSRAAP